MKTKLETIIDRIKDLELENSKIDKDLVSVREDKQRIITREAEYMNKQELLKKDIQEQYGKLKEFIIKENLQNH